MLGLIATTIALALGASAAPMVPIADTGGGQGCHNGMYIIVARGTDEPVGEGSGARVADMVKKAIPGSLSVAVDYPASAVDPFYWESVTAGIKDMKEKIISYANACPAGKIALIGFSQGGNVITDVLAGGVDKPDPLTPRYARRITAATVFGDPSFTPGQPFDVGTSHTDGLFFRGGDSLKALRAFSPILRSYCNDGDFFCAGGLNKEIHGMEVPTYAQAATNFIVSRFRAP